MPGIVLKTFIYKETIMSPVLGIHQKTKYLPFGGLHLGPMGPGGAVVQNMPASTGEGNGTPLQYCCPENPMDGEAW